MELVTKFHLYNTNININTNTNTNTNSKSNFYPNPTPKPKPNLRHNLEPNSSNHTLTNVSSFSDDLFRQFDSSDTSDVMDDVENRCSLHQTSGKRKEPISKNLVSERKRRKKLNERLYSLRAIVPNISKVRKCAVFYFISLNSPRLLLSPKRP